jgi:hypothetical protein
MGRRGHPSPYLSITPPAPLTPANVLQWAYAAADSSGVVLFSRARIRSSCIRCRFEMVVNWTRGSSADTEHGVGS